MDSVLSNSFNNLKYDVREIYRLINEIKNILIEAEPKNVKERVAVIETSLQDHVATLKTLEVVVAELKTSIDEIKDFNNINNIGIEEISRNIGSLLIKNQRNLEKVSKSIEIVLKNDLERKKETRELRQALKNIEKEVKKKLKMVRITAKAPIKHSYNTERPRITSAQFEAKRKGDLNSEWLEISGKGDMTGYVLQDKKRKHTYKFPNAFLLDGAVKIHTGEGQDTEKQLYWGNKLPIWNDNSDVAAIKNRKGVIVSKARSERV
ncbi:MAG: lamin tail domain-containing protein, partial [Candidatus Woesearchaeota archaeon]|nr:lamin tail domain-containing protein [Candidatus Woesearchaeota archaeon]